MSIWKKIKIWDGTTVVRVDSVTGAIATITDSHLEIHEGEHFMASHQLSLNNGASSCLLFIAPNTATRIHLLYGVESFEKVDIELFEAPTVSSNGTAIVGYNNDRNSINTPTLLVYHTPTVSANGTSLYYMYADEESRRSEFEVILKQGETYLLKTTSYKDNNLVRPKLSWYEES